MTTKVRARLRIQEGPAQWVYDLVDDRTDVGRHPVSTVQILDRIMSKHHLRIVRNGDGHLLYDLDSYNGTRVNGERIEMAKLRSGDLIEFGNAKAIYEIDPPPHDNGPFREAAPTPIPQLRAKNYRFLQLVSELRRLIGR